MFIFKAALPDYVDPWQSSVEERLRLLAKGERRVAYYYDYPDNSTFRYRVYNMIQVLGQSSGRIAAAYFSYAEQDYLDQVVDLADVLVVCRARYNHKLNQAITRAQQQGKLVFYDIDDLVFDTAYTHLIMDMTGEDLSQASRWDYWFGYISRLSAALKCCDRIITTNANLGEHLHTYSAKPVAVIPNFINQEQMEISDRIYAEKKARGFERDGRIHLGYFSGTPTHNKDFDLVADALLELLRSDPRIFLRLVGYVDLKEPFNAYADRIQISPITDFKTLQISIGEVEINLAPLLENVFTQCKSELKFFEAGITGTLTVASPVYTFARAIRDGENGCLAKSYEWFDKINTLINQLGKYPDMAEKARQDSERAFAWRQQVELVEKTLFPNLAKV